MNGASFAVRVVGTPKATPRTKSRAYLPKDGGKMRAMTYTPKDADDWKGNIMRAVRSRLATTPFRAERDQAVWLSLEFLFRRPKGHIGKHGVKASAPIHYTQKPDRDNLEKAVLDALKDCGILFDDALVVDGSVKKVWAAEDEDPGVFIHIKLLGVEE